MKKVPVITFTLLFTSLIACKNGTSDATSVADTLQTTNQHTATAAMPSPVLPSFVIQDEYGKTVNLQNFKGKKVFINLWASWCPPCRKEMPSIVKLSRSVDTSKVAFVLLSLDNSFEHAKNYKRNQKLDLPVYYPGENLPSLFSVQGIPTTFIFNEKGELKQRIDGGENYNTDRYRKLLQ